MDEQFSITLAEKKLFCLEFVKQRGGFQEAYAAAMRTGLWARPYATLIAEYWQLDEEIVEELERLTKDKVGLELWSEDEYLAELIKSISKTGLRDTDRIAYLKLYAEVRGFVAKDKNTVNVNVGIVNKVMKVTEHKSDDEWEMKIAAQQSKLLEHASS